MTWNEVKVASLQKMFAIEGDTIEENDSVGTYVKSMPSAANEAIAYIIDAGVKPMKYVDTLISAEEIGDGYKTVDLAENSDDFGEYFGSFYMRDGEPPVQYPVNTAGFSTVYLPKSHVGTWRSFYFAYPARITATTGDDAAMPLPEDANVIIPLYIASELYKDDDISTATMYRNEFESALQLLVAKYRERQIGGVKGFTSVYGW